MKKSPRHSPLTPLSRKAKKDLLGLDEDYYPFKCLLRRQRQRYRREYFRIHVANARDFRRARRLTVALESLLSADLTDVPIASNIAGEWKPFRVEHGVSGSLRGDIVGEGFTGTMTQSLLDSSSVIFLQDADDETMRVLIPSPKTSREMLASSLKHWRTMAGYQNVRDWWGRDQDTHTSLAIHNFALNGEWTNILSHPEVKR